MRLVRSLRGGSSDKATTADDTAGVRASAAAGRPDAAAGGPGAESGPGAGGTDRSALEAPGAAGEPTDETRAAELAREFEAGLSDLVRRQVQYSSYAWEPPAQLDRRGRWVVTEATEGIGHDGRTVSLRAGEDLELDEPGEERAGRTSWRFVWVKDGRTVDLPAGPEGSWPDGLERPRTGTWSP